MTAVLRRPAVLVLAAIAALALLAPKADGVRCGDDYYGGRVSHPVSVTR